MKTNKKRVLKVISGLVSFAINGSSFIIVLTFVGFTQALTKTSKIEDIVMGLMMVAPFLVFGLSARLIYKDKILLANCITAAIAIFLLIKFGTLNPWA